MSQLMCKTFSWPCLWEYRFWELCAQMRLHGSCPAMAVDSCWLLFNQCNCDGQFCIHLIGSQCVQMLGKHFRGSVNIFLGENNIWMGRLGEGDFPFATDMYQSLCWGLKQKEEGREERIHMSYVISCAGVLVFARLDHLPSSFKHF